MSGTRFPHVATFDDGSQVLIDVWMDDDGHTLRMTAARREKSWHTWGPPVELERA